MPRALTPGLDLSCWSSQSHVLQVFERIGACLLRTLISGGWNRAVSSGRTLLLPGSCQGSHREPRHAASRDEQEAPVQGWANQPGKGTYQTCKLDPGVNWLRFSVPHGVHKPHRRPAGPRRRGLPARVRLQCMMGGQTGVRSRKKKPKKQQVNCS